MVSFGLTGLNTDRGDELFEQVIDIDPEYEDAINQFKLVYSAELESIKMEEVN